MAPRTVADVEDTLYNAFAWRRIELHALKGAIEDAEKRSPSSPLARALARSGVTMLYAHWEGFAKEACQCYVDYVAKRRLRFDELNDGFLQTALLALGKRAMSGDPVGISALLEAVRRPAEARARIPKATIVDTRSNLRYAVLVEILAGVGCSAEVFATKDKLIDRSLCDARNGIAHGRDLFPSPGSFAELHSEVLDMMGALRDLILEAVRNQQYKK